MAHIFFFFTIYSIELCRVVAFLCTRALAAYSFDCVRAHLKVIARVSVGENCLKKIPVFL